MMPASHRPAVLALLRILETAHADMLDDDEVDELLARGLVTRVGRFVALSRAGRAAVDADPIVSVTWVG